jgi:hypothetical protein
MAVKIIGGNVDPIFVADIPHYHVARNHGDVPPLGQIGW